MRELRSKKPLLGTRRAEIETFQIIRGSPRIKLAEPETSDQLIIIIKKIRLRVYS